MTGPEFLALVRGLPELEFLVPITRHRLRWTGNSRVAVAAHWNSDALDFPVYEPSGGWLEVLDEEDWKSLHGYEALFMVRPRETAGTRIGRQPDVPGPVIQDPGDGQQATILRWRVARGEEVSFDAGQFGSPAEFHAAVAETMETRSVWNPGTGALADGSGDCGGPLELCPPVGGGFGSFDYWEDPSTFIERIMLTKQLDVGKEADMELQLQMFFLIEHIDRVFYGPVWEHYDVVRNEPIGPPDEENIRWLLHYVSVKLGGATAWVEAVEMDPFPNPDDQMGVRDVELQDNGKIIYFLHDRDPAMQLTLEWEVEDPDDVDDVEDRGRSR